MNIHPIKLKLVTAPQDKTTFVGLLDTADTEADEDDGPVLLFSGSDPLEIWSALQEIGASLNAKVEIGATARRLAQERLALFLEAIK